MQKISQNACSASLILLVTSFAGAQQGTPAKPPAATAPPAVAAATPAAQVTADYVIGPDDALSVTVWKETNFSGAVMVRPDGMISIPLLGDIPSAGLTPAQLSADIENRLKKYVTDPRVTVSVQAVNSKRVFVIGEVGHVGPLSISTPMSPLQAIAAAGGLTTYANAKHIYILRTVGTKKQKIPFNYKTALKDGDMQGVTLMPGDTIVVP